MTKTQKPTIQEALFDLKENIRQRKAHRAIADGNQVLAGLSGTPQQERQMLRNKILHHEKLEASCAGLEDKIKRYLKSCGATDDEIQKVYQEVDDES